MPKGEMPQGQIINNLTNTNDLPFEFQKLSFFNQKTCQCVIMQIAKTCVHMP